MLLNLESNLKEKQDLEFKWLAINKKIQEQKLVISGDEMLRILKSNSKNAVGQVSEVSIDKKGKRKVVTFDQQIIFGEEMLNYYKEQEEGNIWTDSLSRYTSTNSRVHREEGQPKS
jgi:hypothetical protein